jgi:hypothetical protein
MGIFACARKDFYPAQKALQQKHFKFHQIPGMPGAVVRYTSFALVCYLNKFYFGLLVY